MAPDLQMTLLGGLRITRNAQDLEGFVSRKVPAIAAYLALSERPVARAVLMELFWGDMPDRSAQTNLRKALSNLGQVLGEAVQIKRDAVQLDHGRIAVDAVRFGQLCRTPDADLGTLHAAVELYRGDFLDGVAVRDAAAFEEWAATMREQLRGQMEGVLYTLGLQYGAAGEADWAKSSAMMQRLLQFDPYHEEAYRHLMTMQIRLGQRSAAIATYEACRQRLEEDLGIEPMPETVALYERIRHAGQARQNRLPAEPTPFVGRREELAALIAALDAPDGRLLTILGAGGMGKSRLALRGALLCADHFWDGAWFIPLAGVAPLAGPSSADELSLIIAGALSLVLQGGAPARRQLVEYLRDKHMLLVLDNFEHMLDAGDLLAEIASQAEQVKLVVTSRERLNVYEEQVLEIAGLRVPGEGDVAAESLEQFSAVDLFCQHARRINAQWQAAPDQAAAIAGICRMLQGMPLGIELAASWVRVMSCAEIARQIAASLDFLTTAMRNVPERHRSLRAVFDYSWQLLGASERAALAQIAVFRGGFSLAAALNVTSASVADLAALSDKSLLRRAGEERYEVQETLRQFAYEHLAAQADLAAIQSSHAAFYLRLAARCAPRLRGEGQLEALGEIGRDLENIRRAWEWALERGDVAAIGQALPGVFQFFDTRSRFQEGESLLRQALEMLGARGDPRMGADPAGALIQAQAQARHGWFLFHLGQPQASHDALRASLDQLRGLGAEAETTFNLNYLGAVLRHRGEYAEAERRLTEGLEIARRAGDRWSASVSLNILGQLASLQGDYDQARRWCGESLRIKREIGDQWGITFSLMYLGRIEQAQGNYAATNALFRESMAISERFGDRRGAAFALQNLGDAAYEAGEDEQAASLYARSLRLYEEIGVRQEISLTWTRLAAVAASREDWPAARHGFAHALAVASGIGSAPALLAGLAALAAVYRQLLPAELGGRLLAWLADRPAGGISPRHEREIRAAAESAPAGRTPDADDSELVHDLCRALESAAPSPA